MAGESPKLEQTLRNIRILHGVFMVTMAMYAYVLRFLVRAPALVDPVFFGSTAGIAVGCYSASFLVRARKVAPAIERLRVTPDDDAALKSWRIGTILSDVVMECVVLFGFALYCVGATAQQVAPFFAIPFVTMLFLFPKRP
jgi:hypothetical protein